MGKSEALHEITLLGIALVFRGTQVIIAGVPFFHKETGCTLTLMATRVTRVPIWRTKELLIVRPRALVTKGICLKNLGSQSSAKVFNDHLNILFKWSKTKVAKLISTPELRGG